VAKVYVGNYAGASAVAIGIYLYNSSSGPVNVIVDVFGYYSTS